MTLLLHDLTSCMWHDVSCALCDMRSYTRHHPSSATFNVLHVTLLFLSMIQGGKLHITAPLVCSTRQFYTWHISVMCSMQHGRQQPRYRQVSSADLTRESYQIPIFSTFSMFEEREWDNVKEEDTGNTAASRSIQKVDLYIKEKSLWNVCWCALQCVAVCCSVLQCVAVCCSVLLSTRLYRK